MAVEPTRAWLHVVPKRQTQVLELTDFLAMLVAEKVDHMGYAQGLELLHVAPGGDLATKCQAFRHKKCLHAAPPLCVPNPFVKHMICKRRFGAHWPCQMSHLPHLSH